MRPASIDDIPLVEALSDVFSRYGYEGASLNRLSEAAGLKRASLYHRFPGGKEEIVQAVIGRAADQFERLLAPAFGEGTPGERTEQVAAGLDEYYDGGNKSCLIVALSLSDSEHRASAVNCVESWSDALAHIAKDSGHKTKDAEIVSLDAVAAIEGALVISATSGRTGPFERALAALPERILKNT